MYLKTKKANKKEHINFVIFDNVELIYMYSNEVHVKGKILNPIGRISRLHQFFNASFLCCIEEV